MANENLSEKNRLPIDRGWSWMIVVACFGHVMLLVMTLRATSILFVEFMNTFESSTGMTSIIPALVSFGNFASSLLSAALSERFGVRPIVYLGSLLWVTGCISSAFITSLTQLYFTYGLLLGVGLGFVYVPSFTLLGKYFKKRRTLAFGIAGIGSGCGSVIGPVLIQFLLDTYGLCGCLVLYGGILLHNLVFASLLRPIEFFVVPQMRTRDNHKTSKVAKPPDQQELIDLKEAKSIETNKPSPQINERLDSSTNALPQTDDDFFKCEPRQRSYTFQDGASADAYQLRQMFQEWRQQHRNVNIREYMKERAIQNKPSKYSSHESGLQRLQTPNTILPRSRKPSRTNLSHSITIAAPSEDILSYYISDGDDGSDTSGTNCSCFGPGPSLVKWKLFKDPVFLLHTCHAMFAILAVPIPLIFIGAYCEDVGISITDAARLYSLSGITEFVVRPLIGWVSDLNLVPKLYLKAATLGSLAALTLSWTFVTTFVGVLVMELLAMSFTGVYFLLEAVVLVDLLGIHNLSSAFGMTLTIQSIGYLSGPIIAGHLRDISGDWTWSYSFSGVNAFLSVILLLAIPVYRKYRPDVGV